MPLYEYLCADCATPFEALRPMSESDKPMACPYCANSHARRLISTFAAISKDGGGSRLVASSQGGGAGGGCGACGGGHCASCGH